MVVVTQRWFLGSSLGGSPPPKRSRIATAPDSGSCSLQHWNRQSRRFAGEDDDAFGWDRSGTRRLLNCMSCMVLLTRLPPRTVRFPEIDKHCSYYRLPKKKQLGHREGRQVESDKNYLLRHGKATAANLCNGRSS